MYFLQEKSDEVTNKFLDKRKDSYQTQPQPLAAVNVKEDEINKPDKYHPQKGPKKRQSSAKKKQEDADYNLTEDEMSVNIINK